MQGGMVGCKILQIDAEKFTTCLGKTRLPFCARDIRHLLSKQAAFGSKLSASWSQIWILTRRLESYLSKSLHQINKGISDEAEEFQIQVRCRNYRILWVGPCDTYIGYCDYFPNSQRQYQYFILIALWLLVSVFIGYCDYFALVPR